MGLCERALFPDTEGARAGGVGGGGGGQCPCIPGKKKEETGTAVKPGKVNG